MEIPVGLFGETLEGAAFSITKASFAPITDLDPSDYLVEEVQRCLLYTSPSPRDRTRYRMPSSA